MSPSKMSPRLTATRTVQDDTSEVQLLFTWEGGPYIEVTRISPKRMPYPMEVINVWDYSTNTCRIPFTRPALRDRVDEWIDNYTPRSLVHDVLYNWC